MKSLVRLAAASVMFVLFAPLPVYSQAQDTNSLSSQGFSLRISSSHQVTIQNSTLILLPANIPDSQLQAVMKTVILHKTVDEIEKVARGAKIKVILQKMIISIFQRQHFLRRSLYYRLTSPRIH